MRRRASWVAVLVAVAALAFLLGRGSADPERRVVRAPAGGYAAGYRAGHEDAFSGYDGGWILGDPYIVTLRHGGPGFTYRFARRWPLLPGMEYRICDQDVICSRRISPRR